MHLPTTKQLLEKIVSLHQKIAGAQGKMSALENDLLLDYLRQFYDQVLHSPTVGTLVEAIVSTPPVVATPPPPPPPRRDPAPPKIEISAVVPPPAPRTVQPPVMPPLPIMEATAPTPPTPPLPPPVAPVLAPIHAPDPVVMSEPRPTVASEPTESSSAIRNLFRTKKGTELSDRLSSTPVTDIKKALAINDRMLIVNDLFGKSADQFEQAINSAQLANSYDEACQMLLPFANKHNWADEEKTAVAQQLIGIVKRRFT